MDKWLTAKPSKALISYAMFRDEQEKAGVPESCWLNCENLNPEYSVRKNFYEKVLEPFGHTKTETPGRYYLFSREFFTAFSKDKKKFQAWVKLLQ